MYRFNLDNLYTGASGIQRLCLIMEAFTGVNKKLYFCLEEQGGPGSVDGIATGYRLDGPGIESRRGRDIRHLSRPALGPTQPPVQWVPCLSRG